MRREKEKGKGGREATPSFDTNWVFQRTKWMSVKARVLGAVVKKRVTRWGRGGRTPDAIKNRRVVQGTGGVFHSHKEKGLRERKVL